MQHFRQNKGAQSCKLLGEMLDSLDQGLNFQQGLDFLFSWDYFDKHNNCEKYCR